VSTGAPSSPTDSDVLHDKSSAALKPETKFCVLRGVWKPCAV
jgi:hypothetical protein